MRLTFLTMAAALAAGSAWAAADPEMLNLVAPGAAVLAGVQVDQAKASAFGQYLVTQMSAQTGFDKLADETGFDPRTDLTEILAASAGPDYALMIARGAFQPTRILTLAESHGATAEMYRGVSIITVPDGQGPGPSAAFLNATLLVAGNKAMVENAVDRWITAAAATDPLSDRARTASATAQAWMVTGPLAQLRPDNSTAEPLPPALESLLQSFQSTSGGVKLGDENIVFEGEATTQSAEDAQSLADVLRLLASLAPPEAPAIQTTVTTDGAVVHLSASLSEAQAEQLFQPHTSN